MTGCGAGVGGRLGGAVEGCRLGAGVDGAGRVGTRVSGSGRGVSARGAGGTGVFGALDRRRSRVRLSTTGGVVRGRGA